LVQGILLLFLIELLGEGVHEVNLFRRYHCAKNFAVSRKQLTVMPSSVKIEKDKGFVVLIAKPL
jgi:hypothetical protein